MHQLTEQRNVNPDALPHAVVSATKSVEVRAPARMGILPGVSAKDAGTAAIQALRQELVTLAEARGIPPSFTRTRLPTLSSGSLLVFASDVPPGQYEPLFGSLAESTAITVAEGVLPGLGLLDDGAEASYAEASIFQLEQLFEDVVQEASWASVTKATYQAGWNAFLSFAIAKRSLALAFPATACLLKAFLVTLLVCGYAKASIIGFMAAISHRHTSRGFPSPAISLGLIKWQKALGRILGASVKEKHPIELRWLVAMLERISQQDPSLITCDDLRDTALVVTGTIAALRPSELISLDVCDTLLNCNPGVLGLGIYIKRRKNDPQALGLCPRIGFATLVPHICQVRLII